jgi:hypothetical protein
LCYRKDSKTGEIKHSLHNVAENTSIEKLAEMQSSRYWVERAFQDAKENCGMDEYMVRSWVFLHIPPKQAISAFWTKTTINLHVGIIFASIPESILDGSHSC